MHLQHQRDGGMQTMSTFPKLQGSDWRTLIRYGTFTGDAKSHVKAIHEVGKETINFALGLHPEYKPDPKSPLTIDQFVKAKTFFINDGVSIDQNGNAEAIKNAVVSVVSPNTVPVSPQDSMPFRAYTQMAEAYMKMLVAQKCRTDQKPTDPQLTLEGDPYAYA
jgi:hypothetical protein